MFVIAAVGAGAASLQPTYDVLGDIAVERSGVYVHVKDDRLTQATPVQVSFEGSFGANTASYFASSQPGVVRIYAESSGQPGNLTGSQAYAYFQDYITVTGAPANSSLQVTFAVDGFGNDNYDGVRQNPRTSYINQDTLQMAGQACSPVLNTLISSYVSGTCQLTIPVTNGTPLPLILHLQGYVENRSGDSSILDFSHTGRITSFQLVDGSGTQLPDLLISTASGFTYPNATASVPEPASLFLLLAGLEIAFLGSRPTRPKPRHN